MRSGRALTLLFVLVVPLRLPSDRLLLLQTSLARDRMIWALMLLNGDVVQVGRAVEVKRGSRAWFVLAVPTGLFLAYSLVICVASVAASSADWGELVLSLALLVPLHGLMWRVWLLLYIRVPMAPLRASKALTMVSKNHRPAA
jgi:hypothetical protein